MTYFLFFIPLTVIFFLLILVRNEILSLKSEINRLKEDVIKLEETTNAKKQSEPIDEKKKWKGLLMAFTPSKTVEQGYSIDRRRP